MSTRIKDFLSRISSDKRRSLVAPLNGKHIGVMDFGEEDGQRQNRHERSHDSPHRGRSRKRGRSLSLTEEKNARKATRAAEEGREEQERDARKGEAYENDPLNESYGDFRINGDREELLGTNSDFLDRLSKTQSGDPIRFRARIHHARPVGPRILFLVFRRHLSTIQGVLTEEDGLVSQNMVRWAESLHTETIVWVQGKIQTPQGEQDVVKSTTIHEVEIKIEKLHVIARPTSVLPFQVEDADRPLADLERPDSHFPKVGQTTRFTNRVLELRTPVTQSIFRINSGITRLFREFLDERGFTEIQSSKFQASATESGAAVFKVDYFRRPVFLAQSPQLAKQMCIAGDMERVYEIGPVFRAENSNTHRHLTEFTGLDLEMAFENHYHEVLDLIDQMFLFIFKTLFEKYRNEIETVKLRYPHEDLVFLDETPRFKYADAIHLLVDSGWIEENGSIPSSECDLSLKAEKALGRVIKEHYNTDYYILDKFPSSERPFYTMPDSDDPKWSNSYDFFIRGEEVLSGGQRIHHAALLEERLKVAAIDPKAMKEYVDGFRWGCPPHGGGGIGLERVVMLFLHLEDIRWASLFPRDPKSFAQSNVDLAEASMASAAHLMLHGPESKTSQHLGVTQELPPLENLIAAYGDATNTSWIDPFWTVWRDRKTGAAVGYVEQNGYAVTFGNPLCEQRQIPQVTRSYLHYIQGEKKLKPVWCCVDIETERVLAQDLGWSAVTAVAEERFNPTEVEPEKNDKTVRRKVHRAERDGVRLFDVDGKIDEDTKKEIEERLEDWKKGRKGSQIHLTGLRPFEDPTHRKCFYARDSQEKICAMVVLAQLAPTHGFQIKWALEFPGAPLGAIEYILTHVIKKMGDMGIRSATFGAGSTGRLERADNVGGFRVMTMEKTYNGISHTFSLGNKGDFRSKFGIHQDPLYICYPKNGLGVRGIEAIMNTLQRPK